MSSKDAIYTKRESSCGPQQARDGLGIAYLEEKDKDLLSKISSSMS